MGIKFCYINHYIFQMQKTSNDILKWVIFQQIEQLSKASFICTSNLSRLNYTNIIWLFLHR